MTETLRLPFPWALHEMLDEADDKGFSSMVSWGSDGTCFKVHDTKAFMKHVAPRYFRQTRYKSFQRQLHLYGFSRIASGQYRGHRAHDLFLRGQKNLCANMKPMRMRSQASDSIATSSAGLAASPSMTISQPRQALSIANLQAEDDDACLRSFIDRFYDTTISDVNGELRHSFSSEVADISDEDDFEDVFSDVRSFPAQNTQEEMSFGIDSLQPTPIKEKTDMFAPNMIISTPLMKGGQAHGLGGPNPRKIADYSYLDTMLSSFISRAA